MPMEMRGLTLRLNLRVFIGTFGREFSTTYSYYHFIFSPSNHYQKPDVGHGVKSELSSAGTTVPSAVPHPQFSSKIDKYRKKVNIDKGEKKKDEQKIKEVKKEYPKGKPKVTQVNSRHFITPRQVTLHHEFFL